MASNNPNKPVRFINIRAASDVVFWYGYEGVLQWTKTHTDGLKSYLGEDGTKMQICWENDNPCPYWGW